MKQRVLTGIKPTADQIHIGNYFGAVKPMIDFANSGEHEVFLFVPDLHAFTALHDPELIRKSIMNQVKLYIAGGLNLNTTLLYKQSDVPGHTQLARILGCIIHMGHMKRMHAYKAAVDQGNEDDLSVGTFTYPVLMAADILLYDAHLVPVGQDQKQHVEIARDIALKCNHKFGEMFVVPQPLIKKDVAIVPGLDGRKMSKSYNNFLGLLDSPEILRKKINKIISGDEGPTDVKNPETSILYQFCCLFMKANEQQDLAQKYRQGSISYKEVKDILYDLVVSFVTPIQQKFSEISDEEVEDLLAKNAIKANVIANAKIDEVYKIIGFR